MYKVRAVLRSTEKDLLENIEDHIEVIQTAAQANTKTIVNPLQTILKSISTKNILALKYVAVGNPTPTERYVEPVGIFYKGNFWYLIGFCRLRNDYRNFRIDRITKFVQCDERFEKEHPSLKSYLEKVATEQELHTVVMQADKGILQYLEGQKYYNGYISQKEVGERVEMTFLTAYLEAFARWYIMFGDRADIITPVALKGRVKEILDEVAKKL